MNIHEIIQMKILCEIYDKHLPSHVFQMLCSGDWCQLISRVNSSDISCFPTKISLNYIRITAIKSLLQNCACDFSCYSWLHQSISVKRIILMK